MEYVFLVLAIPVLLLLQGFFSGSEIALVHSDKTKLRGRAKQGDPGSRLALRMFERPEVILTTTLIGTNISLVVNTVLATTLMIILFGDSGEFLAVLLLTPLTLILGEIVPKSVYQQESDKLTPKIIYPVYLFSLLLFPIVFVFSRATRLAARLAGQSKPGVEMFAVREQLRALLEAAEGAHPVEPFDHIRIRNVVRFGELCAADLMMPASEMTAIDSSNTTVDAIRLVRKTGYTHLPVYDGKRSNIVGMVSLTAWDLVEPGLAARDLAELAKPAYFVPAQQQVAELLPVLRRRDDQGAIVVDEFGSAIGLITVQMILESIVGKVDVGSSNEDSMAVARPSYERLDDDVYLMDARLPIADVNDLLATRIGTATAHTIGGLVVARLRHVPAVGESIVEGGFSFTVEEATDRAITRLRAERTA